MKKKIYTLIIFAFCAFCFIDAQDVHFSQNFAAPLYYNPATTGVYNGQYRANAIYRNQWYSVQVDAPYRSIYASFDSKISTGHANKNYFSAGIALLSDQAGDLNLKTNQVELSLSYSMRMNDVHGFSFGILGGLGQKAIDYSSARFGNQYDGLGHDSTLASGEALPNENVLYPNLGAGLLYFFSPSERSNVFVGAGMYNILSPKVNFTNFTNRLPYRISIQAGGSIEIGNSLDIAPTIYVNSQQSFIEMNSGVLFRYLIQRNNAYGRKERAFGIGPYFRMSGGNDGFGTPDALILMSRLDYESFSVGLSYDINLSDFTQATNRRGGFEISVAYTARTEDRSQNLHCPRF